MPFRTDRGLPGRPDLALQSRLDALAAELAAEGIEGAGFADDVLDRPSLRAALDAAAQRFGRIDVLEYSPAPSGGAPDLAGTRS